MNNDTRNSSVRILVLGLTVISFAFGGAAQESTTPEPSPFRQFLERDYLFGDWGGLRTDLSKHGIDFEFFYAGSVPSNLDGGLHRGTVYQGGLLMALDVDSQKLLGYEGGQLHASSVWLHGEKPFSDHYVGDLNKVNLIDFPNAFRLWELWYQQKFLDGKLSFKFGEMSVDRDFIVPEQYNSLAGITLLNQTFFYPTLAFDLFGVPGLPSQNHGLPSTPNAAPGALLRWDPCAHFYAQAAVYGGNPDMSSSGADFHLSEEEGALSYFEMGYRRNHLKTDEGLESSIKLGGWFHTGDFVDVYEGIITAVLLGGGFPVTSPPHNYDGNYGGYVLFEQQLFREVGKEDPTRQGLVGFLRAEGAPPDRNLADFGIDGGVVYKGLIPSRDWDTLALAGSYMRISDEIAHAQRDANQLAPGLFVLADYEAVIELSYKLQMTAWWTLQPSLQYVWHPGGSSEIPNATVLIIQTTLRF